MLQKSVEDFAENDIKFKKLVKDAVREELKSYKEHNDKQIQIIFEKLQLYREDLRITYKLIQEIIELFGLHKENSELHRKKVDESLSELQMDFEIYQKEIYPTELIEVFKKMEAKFQSQRNDINVIAYSLRTLQMDYKYFKKKYEIERKIENLDKANSNKVEILDIEGGSDGK